MTNRMVVGQLRSMFRVYAVSSWILSEARVRWKPHGLVEGFTIFLMNEA